jgi:beta-glucanase (GH16 family)
MQHTTFHSVWIAVLMSLISAQIAVLAETPAAEDGYQLVWSDEFNKDGPPDRETWVFEKGFVRNKELQWYQEDNAFCRDGLLVIEARREQVANPRFMSGSRDWQRNRQFAEYTSACVETSGKHQWLYGRFVMRGRIDTRLGMWPAFWTLGSARGWPGCGEIDIMEYFTDTLLANAYWQGKNGTRAGDMTEHAISDLGAGWAEAFHIWQLDWNAEALRITMDGKLLNEVSLSDTIHQDDAGVNPFHEPHYLLLNLAIGSWGGDPSATEFPARFEVDYVRVYQKGK